MNIKKEKVVISIAVVFVVIFGAFFYFFKFKKITPILNSENKNNIASTTVDQKIDNEEKNKFVLSDEEKAQFNIPLNSVISILTEEEKKQYNVKSVGRVHFMTEEEKKKRNITTDKKIPIEMLTGDNLSEEDKKNFVGPVPVIYMPEELMQKTSAIDENTDSDKDGLTDVLELKEYSTDPNKADTDGDGILDGDEVNKYHTDPNKIDKK